MSLTDSEINAIADTIASRVVARLREATPPPAPATSADDILSGAEVRALLKINSGSAQTRVLKNLGVRKVSWNRYRRGDIENAIARATAKPRKPKQ